MTVAREIELKDKFENLGAQMVKEVASKTNDDTRDIAIRIVDKLVEGGFIKDCIDTDDESEFEVQDLIQEVLNEALVVSN